VAHTCNSGYLGGRDQDGGLKPDGANSSYLETLSQKYPTQKRAGIVIHVVAWQPSKHEALIQTPAVFLIYLLCISYIYLCI
jgi:hypothetical protein